jgi:hypothetical protein
MAMTSPSSFWPYSEMPICARLPVDAHPEMILGEFQTVSHQKSLGERACAA